MTTILDFILFMGIISSLLMPFLIICWVFESTKLGNRLLNKVFVPWLIKHDIIPEDYFDIDD